MGFYATDTLQPAPPAITGTRRARRETACGRKPLRGPIHNAISGYRFYNPELGRWVNRDPIGERGGLNVYVFVGNCMVTKFDVLGLQIMSPQDYYTQEVWAPHREEGKRLGAAQRYSREAVESAVSAEQAREDALRTCEGSGGRLVGDVCCCGVIRYDPNDGPTDGRVCVEVDSKMRIKYRIDITTEDLFEQLVILFSNELWPLRTTETDRFHTSPKSRYTPDKHLVAQGYDANRVIRWNYRGNLYSSKAVNYIAIGARMASNPIYDFLIIPAVNHHNTKCKRSGYFHCIDSQIVKDCRKFALIGQGLYHMNRRYFQRLHRNRHRL